VTWRKLHLDLDENGWEDFNDWSRQISRKCASCDSGEILPTVAKCKKCGRDVNADPSGLLLMETATVKCPHCGTVDFMDLEYDCVVRNLRTGVHTPGCGKPSCHSIWDCDLEIVAEPKAKGKGRNLKMLNHYPGPIEDEEIIKAMNNPHKFQYYDFMSVEDQCLIMDVANPFSGTHV
jgi:DNA-directed RNA polymerase subunit RPC12/RpoP